MRFPGNLASLQPYGNLLKWSSFRGEAEVRNTLSKLAQEDHSFKALSIPRTCLLCPSSRPPGKTPGCGLRKPSSGQWPACFLSRALSDPSQVSGWEGVPWSRWRVSVSLHVGLEGSWNKINNFSSYWRSLDRSQRKTLFMLLLIHSFVHPLIFY